MVQVHVINEQGISTQKEVSLLHADIIGFEPEDASPIGKKITQDFGVRRYRVYKTVAGDKVCSMEMGKNSGKFTSYLMNNNLPQKVQNALNFESFYAKAEEAEKEKEKNSRSMQSTKRVISKLTAMKKEEEAE